MSTQPLVPGYLVELKYPLSKSRPASRTFVNPNLLMARQEALQYVQQVAIQNLPTQLWDAVIYLVEIERSLLPNRHTVVAKVFKLHCCTKGGELKEINVTKDALWNDLEQMNCENEYFQVHGYETGFGSVALNQIVERNLLARTEDLNTITAQFYTVLYDSFPYAASLISHFNSQAQDDDVLCFCTEFMPKH